MLLNRIAAAVAGIICTGLGIQSILSFATYRGFPLEHWVGYFLIPFGLALLFAAFTMKNQKLGGEATMCPGCLTPYSNNLTGTPCPKCGTPLENIEGFYDRHPELKQATKEADGNAHTE